MEISSSNNTLLSFQIKELRKQVKILEEKMLSKWDVAMVVSAMITGIIIVATLIASTTYTIMTYAGKPV